MMRITTADQTLTIFVAMACFQPMAQADVMRTGEVEESLATITVSAKRVANDEPAGTYPSIATALRFDPRADLQSRGLPEGQADVTVHGGVFENTGIKVGAVSIFDPQTGHYVAGLPISPESLSGPTLLTGIDNALAGFNSSVATLDYSLTKLQRGGHVGVGVGSHDLKTQTLRVVGDRPLSGGTGRMAGELTYAGSRGEGSVRNGDHNFQRVTIRGQIYNRDRQTDLLLAYQDKFFAWPGAYTGFASLPETDHSKTRLVLLNHRQSWGHEGEWAIGAFYRVLEDDYDFDRSTQETRVPGAFEHETASFAVGFKGNRRLGGLDWQVSGQLSGDELKYSTDLTEGDFSTRHYASLRVAPEKQFSIKDDMTLRLQMGLSLDASNRDRNDVLPLLGLSLEAPTSHGLMRFSLQYAATSQVPGYTALKSRPNGLFGGNAALGRERADTVDLSFDWETEQWTMNSRMFARHDDDLVDWTYLSGAPFARQANAVDLDVSGFETFWYRPGAAVTLAVGYTYLHKEADYGQATVDASFYALNFAKHRLTMALSYQVLDGLELQLDNEYREQQANPLRTTGNSAYAASLGVVWRPIVRHAFQATLTVDNVTDNDFQEFPGTPAAGRQVRIGVRYDW